MESKDEGLAVQKIVVAVCTFGRNDGLMRLLPMLVEQANELTPNGEVLVVDNNPEPTARSALNGFEHMVRYVHEAMPGISAARNRALAETVDAGAIVFIDDDEVPGTGWLSELVTHWRLWNCVGVTGPVLWEFECGPDSWTQASGFYEPTRLTTGAVRPGAATNNLLLDRQWLRNHDLWFDARFGLTGGSDTMITHQIVAAGGQIRWCDSALVSEHVVAERTTGEWVRRRVLRTSNDWSRVDIALASPGGGVVQRRIILGMRGAALMVRAAGWRILGLLTGNEKRRAAASLEWARGRGVLSGAVGIVVSEYLRGKKGR